VRVRIVLGVALALVGAAVVVVLSQSARRLAGTSFVPQSGFNVVIPAGGSACQLGTYLADDSAAAQLLVGIFGRPRPALRVTFADPDGVVVARGRVAGGERQGDVTVPFKHVVDGNHAATTACVRNAGAHRVALGGGIANADTAARVGGRPTSGIVGFRYLRAGRESWWALMPVVAQRFGLGKASLFGPWTLPLLALVLAGLWLAAVRLLLEDA
jgi:hypothetical protein